MYLNTLDFTLILRILSRASIRHSDIRFLFSDIYRRKSLLKKFDVLIVYINIWMSLYNFIFRKTYTQETNVLLLCVQEVVTPIYMMSYYIKWVTTSWTYGISSLYGTLFAPIHSDYTHFLLDICICFFRPTISSLKTRWERL